MAEPWFRCEMHRCAWRNDLWGLRSLLESAWSPDQLAQGGITPLHVARARQHREIEQLLCAHGASESSPDSTAWQLLCEASALGLLP